MKIDRLMGIVIYLLNHGRTSAQSLSEEFEVSPRTIVRDLEALDRAGIPIQSFYGVEGGYQIMDSYVFEKQAATASDFDWIVTALKGLASAYANKSLQQTLEKINSLQLKENNTVSLDREKMYRSIFLYEQPWRGKRDSGRASLSPIQMVQLVSDWIL